MSEPGEIVRRLRACGAFRTGTFRLASGATSDVYVDVKRAWTDPRTLRFLAKLLAQRVGPAQALAGMELGAVPLVVATALERDLPYVVLRKEAKAHGTQRRYEGELAPGARTVVIEDVTTTGGSVATSVAILRDAGASVDRVVTVVDRQEGAAARLQALGVTLEALTTLSELRGSS